MRCSIVMRLRMQSTDRPDCRGIKNRVMRTNASIDELRTALQQVNKEHGYKLEFNRIEQHTSNRVIFTLKTVSKIKGARVSHSGRNLAKASWHAHGYFFSQLFKNNPNVFVDSMGKRISIAGGNWEDMRIGSAMSPMLMSETSIGE